MKHTLTASIVSLVVAVLLAYSQPADAQSLQKTTINFPTRSGASWLLFIAKEGGYYQKYGLDVDLVFAGHPGGIAMVVSGEAQMSSYNLESVMQASVRDASFAVVGSSVDRAFFVLMPRPDIPSVKDLNGKTLAVSQIGDPPYNYDKQTAADVERFYDGYAKANLLGRSISLLARVWVDCVG